MKNRLIIVCLILVAVMSFSSCFAVFAMMKSADQDDIIEDGTSSSNKDQLISFTWDGISYKAEPGTKVYDFVSKNLESLNKHLVEVTGNDALRYSLNSTDIEFYKDSKNYIVLDYSRSSVLENGGVYGYFYPVCIVIYHYRYLNVEVSDIEYVVNVDYGATWRDIIVHDNLRENRDSLTITDNCVMVGDNYLYAFDLNTFEEIEVRPGDKIDPNLIYFTQK